MSDSQILPIGDMAPPKTEMQPETDAEIEAQKKARQEAAKKEMTLRKRINRMPKLLRTVLDAYLLTDDIPLLQTLCEREGIDFEAVQKAIALQETKSGGEHFTAVLMDVECYRNDHREIHVREMLYQIALNGEWPKDKINAAKLWLSSAAKARESQDVQEGSAGILIADPLYGVAGMEGEEHR